MKTFVSVLSPTPNLLTELALRANAVIVAVIVEQLLDLFLADLFLAGRKAQEASCIRQQC